jgi:hypothetical protein
VVLLSVLRSLPQTGTLCNKGETVESLQYRWVLEVGRVDRKLSAEFVGGALNMQTTVTAT